MKKFTQLEVPMNATERYLNGVCERLEVLIGILTPQTVEAPTEEAEKPKRARKPKATQGV